MKIHKCIICNKTLDYKPIRLVKQKYELKPYKQYRNVCNYDFCIECYKIFDRWINKHNQSSKEKGKNE